MRNAARILIAAVWAWFWCTGSVWGEPGVDSVTVEPSMLLVGEEFTITVEASADVTSAVALVDFRPSSLVLMQVRLSKDGDSWVGTGTVPETLAVDTELPVLITVVAFDDARQRVTSPTNVVVQNPVSIPDVTGRTQAEAEAAILAAGLTVGFVFTESSETVPEGNVIRQNPLAETPAAAGSAVDLVVSLGSAPDTTQPQILINSPEDGGVVFASPVTVSGTVTDGGSGVAGVTCNGIAAVIDGTMFSCEVPLSEGPNIINVVATDVAGNAANETLAVGLMLGDDAAPPNVAIVSPTDSSVVFLDRPTIQVTYSDEGSGVATATFSLTANGATLAATCDVGPAGASCVPTNPLPQGEVTLVASVSDVAGNTNMAEVTFTVDSELLEIEIAEPVDRLITNAGEIEVTGTAGTEVVEVDVNGVAATLSGGAFSAVVPLREGMNALVAVGTAANGKTGSDSVDVTRDIVAPIVRITSPRTGFMAVENIVTITGQVNDIVNGASDAEVTVNGVAATVKDGSFFVSRLPLVRGPNVIEAVGTDMVGNVGRHNISVTFQPPVGARLCQVSGDGQEAFIREMLPEPLVVEVSDQLGNPVAGRVVTFSVTRNNGLLQIGEEGPLRRTVQLPTDGSGRARARWTLGDTIGAGNNRVTVTALGVAGEVEFCATGVSLPAAQILTVNGDNQRGAVGRPLATPLEALVVDGNGNPVSGVDVTFEILKGGGKLDGADSQIRTSGSNGIVRSVLTLGPEPGVNNNVVKATFEGLTGIAAIFTSSALSPGNPAETTFAGVVLDNGYTPIPGAVVSVPHFPAEAITDDFGQFLITDVPVGNIHLRIDPSGSPRPEIFPPLEFETITVAGIANVLGQPILLPAIPEGASKIVGGAADVTLTMPDVEGLELTVFANSATFPDGSSTGQVSITQVHLDKVPMPPPGGIIFLPPAWTIQPPGVKFDPPARISIPNDGLPPGRVVDIFQFDHALYQFVNIGDGTVSEDGFVIVSDPGFGITRTGWGGGGPPQPPTTCGGSCDDGNPCTDDSCVDGSCVHTPLTTAASPANGCEGCMDGMPIPKKTDAECCGAIAFAGGYVVCCNGQKLACAGSSFNGASQGMIVLRQCVIAHEAAHFDHIDCPAGDNGCDTTRPPFKDGQDAGEGECEGSKAEVACLESQRASCGGDAACETIVDNRIAQIKMYGNDNMAGCF